MLEQFSHVRNKFDIQSFYLHVYICIYLTFYLLLLVGCFPALYDINYLLKFYDRCPWQNKYRQAYEMSKGTPPAIVTDTPEMIRIRKAQEQLSEVLFKIW